MKKLNYENTSIQITNDGGFSTTTNNIRYDIMADLTDASTLETLFPNKDFSLSGGKLVCPGNLPVSSMWDIINLFQIEQSDVGKTVKEAIQVWSLNIIYNDNLLDLDKEKWQIK